MVKTKAAGTEIPSLLVSTMEQAAKMLDPMFPIAQLSTIFHYIPTCLLNAYFFQTQHLHLQHPGLLKYV